MLTALTGLVGMRRTYLPTAYMEQANGEGCNMQVKVNDSWWLQPCADGNDSPSRYSHCWLTVCISWARWIKSTTLRLISSRSFLN